MTLSEKLFILRKKAGLNQEELSEKLDVSRQAISKWENGESLPEISKLKMIADIFSVTTDFLLDDTKDEFIKNELHHNTGIFDKLFGKAEEIFGKLQKPLGIISIIYGVCQLITVIIFLVNIFAPLPAFSASVAGGAGITIAASLMLPIIKAAVFIAIGIILIKKS